MKINYYDWMHDDITWCASECDNAECFRHPSNIRAKNNIHSFADFKHSNECPLESITKLKLLEKEKNR